MIKGVKQIVALAAGAVLLAPGLASAVPIGWFQAGEDIHYIESWQPLGVGDYMVEFHIESDDYEVSGVVEAKFDPYISYGFSVQNFTGAPQTYAFHFESAIMPIIGDNTVYASFAGSATDVSGNGIYMNATLPDSDGDGDSEFAVTTLNGVNAGIDVGTDFSNPGGFPGRSYVVGPYEDGPQAGPVAPVQWDQMAVDVEFELSPNFDVATVNGFSSIDVAPIPEPSALLLLGGGLLGVAVWRRRKSG